MPYGKVKVYSDGGHYIGIPYEPTPHAGKRRKVFEEMITVTEQPAAEKLSVATAPDGDINIAVGCKPVTIDKEFQEISVRVTGTVFCDENEFQSFNESLEIVYDCIGKAVADEFIKYSR